MATEPGKTGDAGGKEGQNGATPKFEFKDNTPYLDGKKVVLESDLIAAKHSLEKQLADAQTVHDAAIDTAKMEVSTAQQEIAALNAKLKENEQARKSGAVSETEAATTKAELEATKKLVESSTTQVLELRRANIILQSGGRITAEQLKDKSLQQLDAFEEAFKTLNTTRGGPGNYAVGGGTGGAGTETPMERASRVLAGTPFRGTRQSETKT